MQVKKKRQSTQWKNINLEIRNKIIRTTSRREIAMKNTYKVKCIFYWNLISSLMIFAKKNSSKAISATKFKKKIVYGIFFEFIAFKGPAEQIFCFNRMKVTLP